MSNFIGARRALTYTYAMRFYLQGNNKQRFFDFLQGDLERSLEMLNKKNEEDWQLYLDTDTFGMLHLGEKFFRYKQEVNNMRDTVERHFSKTINQIEAGLPEVADEESKAGDVLSLDDVETWTCPTCTTIN